jgi:starch-binding outer membrane protein, SusD/RagB family
MSKRMITALAITMFLLAGCNKFLDSPSSMMIKQEEIFSTEQGFTEALNGVYLQMGSPALYGRELSFGLLSILGRSYDTTILPQAGSLYYQGARYNYGDPAVKAAINTIWDSSYQCIANLNNLLGQIDSKKDVFTGDNYNQVKGEALALRGFLHFDLLRMFGPASAHSNTSAPGIPYVQKLSPIAESTGNTGAVLDACVADLNAAKGLMTVAAKRQGHLDYWAIRALLARIYMYKGDYTNAQGMALEVIGSKQYPLAVSNTDVMFTTEHVFTLYVYLSNLGNYTRGFFNTPAPMGLLPVNQNQLYATGAGSAADWRRASAFLDPATNQPTNPSNPNAVVMPKKFAISSNNAMPLIRLTEMYYIAAECALASNNLARATELLDTVRVHRNLPAYTMAALPADSIAAETEREYRKEMLGEGQLFFYYKRKSKPFDQLPFTKVPVVANATYVFPKPE